MCLAIAIYSTGYSFELGSGSLEEIRFWLIFEYFGLSFIPFIWFTFLYRFRTGKALSFAMNLLLLLIPVLTCFFVAGDEFLHLYYRDVKAVEYSGGLVAQLAKGPWYIVNLLYTNLIIFLSLVISFFEWRKSKFVTSSSALWMLLSSLSVFVAELVYQLNLTPKHIDLAPIGFLGGGICQAIAIWKYRFLKPDEVLKEVVFSGIQEGIVVLDNAGLLSDYNDSAKKLFPWLDRTEIGKPVVGRENARFLALANEESEKFKVVIGGRSRVYSAKASAMSERGRVMGLVYLFRDITSLRRMLRRLKYLANYDALTRTYSGRHFFEQTEKELVRSKRYGLNFGLLMLDIDHFKVVNDTYGHLTGDKVLASIASAMLKRLRKSDTIGRYGGEEFVILLPGADFTETLGIAEDIRALIEEHRVEADDSRIAVTVSIGAAAFGAGYPEITINQLLKKADEALYQAKKAGRNRVC